MLIVGPSDVQRASALFSDLGIRVVSGGRFWVVLLENPIWQLNLSLARFTFGLIVLENCQMLLILSPRLLMLPSSESDS